MQEDWTISEERSTEGWRRTLKEAFDAEFEKRKDPNKPGDLQCFEVDKIWVCGNNPIREYRIDFK